MTDISYIATLAALVIITIMVIWAENQDNYKK